MILTRSAEFMEGYDSCLVGMSRTRNPYRNAISLDLTSALKKFEDWNNGWNKRFHGEELESLP